MCVFVCVCVCCVATALHICVGGEGNALYPLLCGSVCVVVVSEVFQLIRLTELFSSVDT